MFLVLCSSSDNAFIFVPSFVKYLKGFGSYSADAISIIKFAKEHNSIKNIGRVMVLVRCMSLDDDLYL